MLKNYFTIAWRNITLHKIYTVVNVLGLALGICACITIYLITKFDLSFDKFHPGGNRIYRIVGEIQNDKGEKDFLNSVIPDVAEFQNQIPGFEAKAGFIDYGEEVSIPDGDKSSKKFDNRIAGSYNTSTIITWPEYFDIFKYKWLKGNPETLSNPFKVVLTESRAKKYFGNIPVDEMIGKTVIYQDSLRVSVSGIIKDWTENTDFGYTDFISISTATHSFLKQRFNNEDWSSLQPHNSLVMVKLDKGVAADEMNKRFTAFIKEHVKFQQPGTKLTMYLQPLSDIHFTKDFRRGDDGDDFRKAYMPTLYSLMGVAVFILLIAAVNFINLSTAQSIQRAKEIGVRKVLGGNRKNISFQFLAETFVLTMLAAMGLTIFISCMGLFGLGMFTAERRTKEIGIRKVLGASVANITAMLSKDFVLLIFLSIVIASPIAWYFMKQWLQDYAYRTNISWWVFLIAGLSAIFIGLITVSFHAIKAAMANPVKSLRTE